MSRHAYQDAANHVFEKRKDHCIGNYEVLRIKHKPMFAMFSQGNYKKRKREIATLLTRIRGSFFMFVESGCISTNIEFKVP